MILRTRHFVARWGGWDLVLKRVAGDAPRGRPLLIVPGYGMNSFIFGFHPGGFSMEEHLARAGLEVFSVDLRGQGLSLARRAASQDFGLGELADDLGAAIARALEVTETGAAEVDLAGVSLGASVVFAHLALAPRAPVRCVVSMGGPVTWVEIHPLLKLAFSSPRLAGAVHLRGTRALARRLLPFLSSRFPRLLSIYARSSDLSRASVLTRTVEDPIPHVNRQIAHWIRQGELVVRGVNVSRALSQMTHPLLCFVARHDGIVPPKTARFPFEASGSSDKELVVVGTDTLPIAHADLFISTIAHDEVFTPLARFLLSR